MTDNALRTILDRELSIGEAREIIDLGSPLLRDLVDHATNTLQRCVESARRQPNEDIAALMLYLTVIEMIDGVEGLVSKACAVPTIPLLRTSFEALLGLEYLFENQRTYQERSLSWLAANVIDDIDRLERFDSQTSAGEKFARALQNDGILSGMTFSPAVVSEAQSQAQPLRSLLDSAQFHDVMAEYNRLAAKRKHPNWYSLFAGPTNLRELAERLRRPAQYAFLYDQWSAVSHARDYRNKLKRMSNRDVRVRPLRNYKDLRALAAYGATFMLGATRRVLSHFRPTEDIRPWYTREIRERLHNLWSMEILDEHVV
jgi:hypothetical protein